MKRFTYWDNRVQWHGACLFVVETDDIFKADCLFHIHTALIPSKEPGIGCTVETLS